MSNKLPEEFDSLKFKKEVFERLGYGFIVGTIAGSFMYFGQGLILAPRGQRFATALTQMKTRSPLLGGSLALWSGSFALTGGYLKYYR